MPGAAILILFRTGVSCPRFSVFSPSFERRSARKHAKAWTPNKVGKAKLELLCPVDKVAAGLRPAIEPGILPGGKGRANRQGANNRLVGASGRRDARPLRQAGGPPLH